MPWLGGCDQAAYMRCDAGLLRRFCSQQEAWRRVETLCAGMMPMLKLQADRKLLYMTGSEATCYPSGALWVFQVGGAWGGVVRGDAFHVQLVVIGRLQS